MSKFPPDYKQPSVLVLIVIFFLLLAGSIFCIYSFKSKNQIPQGQHTEDMPPVAHSTKRVVIEFVDSLNGRPTYNVLFSDTSYMSSMYPEEIANSLNNGVWSYNEDLEIQ
jgi:hypothetical protein